MICHYFKLVTSCKIGQVPFRLLGMNCFYAKVKNERFTAAGSRCCQNLKLGSLRNDHGKCKYENLTSSFGRLHAKLATKRVPHVHIDSFSLFNQSNR